jgi:tRNA pseudouridine55 synthase
MRACVQIVDREARAVTVHNLVIDHNNGKALPAFNLDVQCSGGTYVRTLIADIGRSLDTRAHMTALIRTKQGPFELKHCLSEEQWKYDAILQHIEVSKRVLPSDISTQEEQDA